MRKMIALLMVCVMLGSLAGCGNTVVKSDVDTDEQTDISTEEMVDSNENLDEEDEENEENVKSEEEIEKEREESLIIYADLIESINSLLPEMEIKGITDSKDGGRDIWINMELQESKDDTLFMYSTLCVKKETEMKNAGITDINVFVYNQGEVAGILMSELSDGRYVPVLNTL